MAQQASSPSNIQQTTSVTPSDEEVEDIILSARFGELEEIQQYAERYGSKSLVEARDERGNGCLHMAAANGHDGKYLPLLAITASGLQHFRQDVAARADSLMVMQTLLPISSLSSLPSPSLPRTVPATRRSTGLRSTATSPLSAFWSLLSLKKLSSCKTSSGGHRYRKQKRMRQSR